MSSTHLETEQLAYIGTSPEPFTQEALTELIQDFIQRSSSSYFFLRWPHTVSGLLEATDQLPDNFPGTEGEWFNAQHSLRWQKTRQGYDLLLLSNQGEHPRFQPLGNGWLTVDRNASVYEKETRFPTQFTVPKVNFSQRCFIDTASLTVQFVALTVKG